jgi:DNA polymerase-3 subunit alpha (Gram-positive type)
MEGIIERMIKIDKPKQYIREDNSPKPRIELFSHTKMSAFDGICSSEDVIKRSVAYRAPAIGFADRHNIQEYPAIAHAAKTKTYDQKILYGVELNLLDKVVEMATNATDDMIDDVTYVIFDIETGGLFNGVEDITEFGAVKVKNRTIVDSIDFFLKPEQPLKQSIIDMTHITQEMVDGGIEQKAGVKKIIEYFGNDVLVAHNGINFDMRFINRKCEKYGLPRANNTCIDTMQISRSINQEYSNHRLGTICRKNKIIYDDSIAHRANFDAEVLMKV